MLDGSFFKDVSLWYADTYPGRDGLIALNSKVKDHYGPAASEKMVGSAKTADEIPVKEKKVKKADDDDLPKDVEPPANKDIDAAVQDAVTNGLYVKDGTVYNIFYFSKDSADRYASIMNATAKQLKKKTKLYSIVVPTNVVLLDKKTQTKLGGSDQAQALQYYASKMSDQVKSVYLPEILAKHRDEYLYFRTDHHWTADGAYYAYLQYCKKKDIKPHKRSYFKDTREYKPLLGTYYQSLQDESLKKKPDTVKAYVPNGTNDADIITADGTSADGHVIADADAFSEANKYLAFLGGDSKLVTIVNDEIEDDSSCMLLCDSYGNAFAPYLVDHYHTVYVADYRYTDDNICLFCKDNKIDDLIVLGSMKVLPANVSLDKLQVDLLGVD